MRIQVNQNQDWIDPRLEKLLEKASSAYPYIYVATAICKECGTERYGIWRDANKFYGSFSNDEQKLLKQFKVDRYPDIEKEILSLYEGACPVCGHKASYIWDDFWDDDPTDIFEIDFDEYDEWGYAIDPSSESESDFDDEEISDDLEDESLWDSSDNISKTNNESLHCTSLRVPYYMDRGESSFLEKCRFLDQIALDVIDNRFRMFQMLENRRYKEEITKIFNELLPRFDLPPVRSAPIAIDAIKSDPEKLKNFILHLIQLETNILSLSERLTALHTLRLKNSPAVAHAPHLASYELRKPYMEAEKFYSTCVDRVVSRKEAGPEPVNITFPVAPAEPIYEIPGFFNKRKVQALNDALKRHYQQHVDQYHSECERIKQQKASLEKENADKFAEEVRQAEEQAAQAKLAMEQAKDNYENYIASLSKDFPETAIHRIIEQEIETAEDTLKKTFAARNELYAFNVIFGKYRDLVCLATFYEYLMAGRCTTLEGANGAYNLYEAEVRANTIISKLSEIVTSLEQIQKNQYTIYSQLKHMNAQLSSIDRSLKTACTAILDIREDTAQIARNTRVIAYNTEVTAYYSKKNAELTDALGYMVAFR